ncbi:hypothetical protein HNP32_002815 [Brevundimonas bullata]|uniref:Microcin J25-processing protein McjB C-terminal domain-containing protein n=1 Tax=Brevundimonas bullata TaxID=13160 RepID=A0A7W7IR77_9CAUL|nr:lasso peptide biosynthesis B2 protein [Brevundimonas bullata]MBB4799059.1 hypothetical protein [Brevundimonas bullata]MBB6384246.1 hypothetical protein [Brevundimonas bullata]
MTNHLWCVPHVHLAVVDEDIVVLDLEHDHYDCLVDAASWLEIGSDGRIHLQDQTAAKALVEAGIATDNPPTSPYTPRVRPNREVIIPSRPPRAETLRALLGLTAATAVFHRKSLLELVRFDLPRPGSTGRSQPLDSVIAALLAAARQARPWVPFEGECLQRSFQLRYYLAQRGITTEWVFGVRTWPFSAHCWLQVGDLIIGDRLERVARYTPIMTA